MKLRNLCREWAPVCAALCLLLVTLAFRQAFRAPPPAQVVRSEPTTLPARPSAPKPPPAATRTPPPAKPQPAPLPIPNAPKPPPTDNVQVEVHPTAPAAPAPPTRAKVQEDPWDFNHALQRHGTTATGGSRPDLLLDGNATVYDGANGYAHTNWPTKPAPSFIVTFKQGVRLNAVRLLLWDKDNRFFRYKLEVSPAMARDEWVLVADRTGETNECRGWQVVTFKTQLVCRLRLTGTYNSANEGFHVVELEAYNIPAGLACPWSQPEF
jgi:hypothetical protein